MPIKRLLQGKPFGHPLHPILVHLPIGLFFLSFVLDVGGMAAAQGPNAFVRPAFFAMALGVITALIASVPGLVDYFDIRKDHPACQIALYHMILNLVAVALYVVNLALRHPPLDESRVRLMPFVLSLICVGIISLSGYLGGVMVYDDGIAVGRHRRHGKTPRDTLKRSGAAGEPVEVVDATKLAEKQTLRAEVNGVVMAVAKFEGQVYAFQEFCTHRYGPLSEGCFVEGGKIKCPWHGSCFDMKTGAVVEGPAKEEIRAFAVVIRDGKVVIETTDERRSTQMD